MGKILRVDGYQLDDVAKEIATMYGAEVKSWDVQDDTLIVCCIEYGDVFESALQLDQIKSFMTM